METVLEKTRGVVLRNVSWDSYVEMADRIQEVSPAHINFDRGAFEIMTVSLQHENLKRILSMILDHLMNDLDIEYLVAGSTTFRRKDLQRGAEPDDCYYIRHAETMRGKKSVDLAFDPPPELALEIGVSHSSVDRMGIFAAIGVQEVWLYANSDLQIFILRHGTYVVTPVSQALPRVEANEIAKLIHLGIESKPRDLRTAIERYANSLLS